MFPAYRIFCSIYRMVQLLIQSGIQKKGGFRLTEILPDPRYIIWVPGDDLPGITRIKPSIYSLRSEAVRIWLIQRSRPGGILPLFRFVILLFIWYRILVGSGSVKAVRRCFSLFISKGLPESFTLFLFGYKNEETYTGYEPVKLLLCWETIRGKLYYPI